MTGTNYTHGFARLRVLAAIAVAIGLIATLVPGGSQASATEDPLVTIERVIAGEQTETGSLSVSDDGLLQATSTTGASTDGETTTASSSPESSVDGAPGEWPMGNRDGARSGDAAWEEFITLPMRQKWAVSTSDKVQVNPAVVGDVAFFGGAGSDRRVYAVELHTQRTRWVVQLPGSVVSAPAVTDHWVYVGAIDGRLYKLSRADGSLAWAYPTLDQPAVGGIWGGPVVHGGVAYFGTTDGNVYAVDAETGELRWSTPTPEAITGAVTLADDTVIAMSGANEWATALDPATGEIRWQRHFYDWADSRTVGTAASIGWSKVYFTGLDEKLHIVWLSTGQDVVTPPNLGVYAQNTPVLTSWGVFVGTNAGHVKGFDQLGTAKWSTTVSTGIVSSPIHAAGRVWAASTDGSLYALDVDDGALDWSFTTGGSLFAPPSIVSNHLLIGSDDSNLYSLTPGTPTNATHSPQAFTHYSRGPQSTQSYESDPVSTTTGNYLYQATDVAHHGGRGIPATFTRTYNSLGASVDGPLGYGWTHQWTTSVSETTDAATITWGDGHTDTHSKDASGNFVAPPDVHDELVATTDGYTLTTKADVIWRFDTSGRATAVVDASGNQLSLAYDTDGNLGSVTDASGRSVTFAYDTSGRILSATDALGQTWTYDYDSAGDLVAATDPTGGTWAYTYDAAHQLTSLTDPDGNVLITNTYDADGRVTEQTDGTGATWTFTYGTSTTTVTDPLGNQTSHEFDANWRTTKITDPTGAVTRFVYDAASNLVAIIDPLDRERRFAYDTRGNLTGSLDLAGHKTAYTWDADDNLTAVTDPRGHATELTYDAAGRITSVTRPSGDTTTLTYRSDGLVDTVTDPTGATTDLAYDADGLLASVTDPLGRASTVQFDAAGQLTAATDPTGATTAYAYDGRGLLEKVTNPLGSTTAYGYEGDGQLATVTDARGNTTAYTHDARGLLTAITDPLGRTTSLGYDAARRLASRTDARGTTIGYVYDAADRLTRIDLPDQTDLTYTYDAAGQLTATADATGTTSYTYDDAGRTVAEHRGFVGMDLAYDYDILGRRIALRTVRPDGFLQAFHRYTYTADGQYATVTDSYQGTTSLGYDAAGRLAQLSQPSGETATYSYDAAGQLTELAHHHPELALSTWAYGYDDAGRRTTARRSFTSATGPVEFTNTYGYDAAGRLTSATSTDPGAPATANATYSYDAVGNRTEVAPAGLAPITYSYDAANQLVADTTTAYDHDAAGNLTARRPLGQTEPTATYDWNALGQVTAINEPDGSATFGYDALGRRVRQQTATDTSDYVFDGGNLLVEQVTKDLTRHWATNVHVGSMLVGSSFPAAQQFFHPDGTGNIGEATTWTWAEVTSPWVWTFATGQLGPAVVYADADAEISRYSYAPYGESNRTESGSLADPVLDRHTYSGAWGVRASVGDLYDMRNRMYDSVLGRFISRDPLEPITLQPYQYAYNDPITYVDPTGQFGITIVIGGVAGAIGGALGAFVQGGDWRDVARGALVGGAVGAIAGATAGLVNPGLLGTAALGSVSGALGDVAGQVSSGAGLDSINGCSIALSSLAGGAGAGFGYGGALLARKLGGGLIAQNAAAGATELTGPAGTLGMVGPAACQRASHTQSIASLRPIAPTPFTTGGTGK